MGIERVPSENTDGERHCFQGIISRSKAFRAIFDMLPRIARSNASVLITGESGTGKELVARAIHHLSPRSRKPLIPINCGGIPESLFESELFGYKKGAFTDAKRDKPGWFKMAEGGTIFLDEIGAVPVSAQAKLLRVLETRDYEPLGATSTERTDARIVSASNKDLDALVESGKFLQDLLYRIKIIPIHIPPLRERREDIPLLIDHFLKEFNTTDGARIEGFTEDALAVLLNHDYPGNVRELRGIVEHAVVYSAAPYIGAECLPFQLNPASTATGPVTEKEIVSEFEKELILRCLTEHNGSIKETARQLGIHRGTLWKKMKDRNICLKQLSILIAQWVPWISTLISWQEMDFC
jgi:transcriptional regulator with PAS, ATPase and Fis domain